MQTATPNTTKITTPRQRRGFRLKRRCRGFSATSWTSSSNSKIDSLTKISARPLYSEDMVTLRLSRLTMLRECNSSERKTRSRYSFSTDSLL